MAARLAWNRYLLRHKDLRGKQANLVFVSATQDDFRWVRNFYLDVTRDWYDDWMAKAELHVEPHSTHSFELAPGVCFERSTVSNPTRYRGTVKPSVIP
jgi:hypothetical protein